MLPRLSWTAKSIIARNPLVSPIAFQLKKCLSNFRPGNIMMFHMGRSGSTVLGQMLNQRPEILWDSEIYAKAFQVWDQQGAFHTQLQTFNPLAYLQKQMVSAGKKYYGVEVKVFQLKLLKVSFIDYADALTKLGFTHFISLERKNALRILVSGLIAAQKRAYHQPLAQQAILTKMTLGKMIPRTRGEPISLLALLRDYEEQMSEVKQVLAKRNVLHLTYEDDIENDPFVGYQRICEFVGLKPFTVKVKLGKTNPFPLKDIIDNYSEVYGWLKDTPYAWMLES